jgi:hypothetical protein
MAFTKKQLESQLKNAKNKALNARDKLTYEMSINRNNNRPEKSGSAYELANAELVAAGEEVKRLNKAIANYKVVEKKKTPKQIADEKEKLRQEDIIAGRDPVAEAAKRDAAANEGKGITGEQGPQIGTAPADRDINKEIAAAAKFLFNQDDATKKAFADRLAAAGYKVANWKSIEDLTSKYQEALTGNQQRNTALGINQTLDEFLAAKVSEQVGGGTGGPEIGITVSSPTQAISTIQSVFRGILNREATPDELSKFTVALNNAERKAGRRTRTVGNRTEVIEDLDRVQFLTDEIKKIKDPKTGKSEFETKKGEKESLTSQELMSIARANGINLGQDQLSSYLTDIRNGKDINVIKNNIRNIAGYGMPDNIKKILADGTDLETVYSPYRSVMASVLELNPNEITLDDSVLRSAIGPDRELPLYEFKRMLKKDSRWQYTNNAREEVSNKVLKVLQDFGFQG